MSSVSKNTTLNPAYMKPLYQSPAKQPSTKDLISSAGNYLALAQKKIINISFLFKNICVNDIKNRISLYLFHKCFIRFENIPLKMGCILSLAKKN